MADKPLPDKIKFGIGANSTRAMVKLADDTYADRFAPAYGSGLVTDSTGSATFDLGSMPSRFTYDSQGNQLSATYGPDSAGRFVRQTSTWSNGLLMGESAWILVDGLDAP